LTDSVCTVAAYTVRFLPVWNPVIEGMITISTLSTVLTNFIHIIFKPIIKTKSKLWTRTKTIIMTQLSDIHLAKSLWHVKRHTIFKEIGKKKCGLTYPQTSNSESRVDRFWSVCNIRQPHPEHIQLCIQSPHSRSG
jgi:hypothetical protein